MALFDKTSGKPTSTVVSKKSKVEGEITYLKVEVIFPNKYQPRSDFDDAGLTELADSIREHGILQPLAVTPNEDESGYYVIAGERRLRAAKIAGLAKVPTIIRIVDNNQEIAELSLIENVQRKDLNPIEAAIAYQRLIAEFKLTQEQIAERTGKNRSTITNSLRLLQLPKPVLEAVREGWPETSARALLPMAEHADACTDMFEKAKTNKWLRTEVSEKVDAFLSDLKLSDGNTENVSTGEEMHVSRKHIEDAESPTINEMTKTTISRLSKNDVLGYIDSVDFETLNVTELRKILVIIKGAK